MTSTGHVQSETQPYVGLRAFRQQDRGLFFGRERESREIATLWQADRLTVLYGTSGVGKTSLLHAGVLPFLGSDRVDALPVGRVAPDPALLVSTTPVRSVYALSLLSSWSAAPPAELAGLTVRDFLDRRPARVDRYDDPIPTLISIDQAEEMFTGAPYQESDLEEFVAQLADALQANAGLHLLLSMRQEYLASIVPFERVLGQGSRAWFHLLPFRRETALEAIRRPLDGTERRFGDNAAELLVDDLQTVTIDSDQGERSVLKVSGVEPVQLQVVCSALWESLPPEVHEITADHVRLYANVDRFLVGFCRRMLKDVAERHNVPEGSIRSWLRRAFITEHGTRGTAYEGLHQTSGMPNAVVRALEDRHILKAEYRAGARWYELQHDRLIAAIRHTDPETFLAAARVALSRADWPHARELTEDAVRTAEFDDLGVRAGAEAIFGDIAVGTGDPEAARRHYGTAAELFAVLQRADGVGQVLAAQGRLSLRLGDYSEAVNTLSAAVARVPGDMSAQTDLARAFWHVGQPRAALNVLNGALAAAGETLLDALALRGAILADLDQPVAALRDLDLVRQRQQPATLAARALALALAGRFDAAGQEAADAIANAGNDGPVLLRAARVHVILGDAETAAALAARAVSADDPALPDHLREQARRLLPD
ncbi:tetratricopeptide repeat protein [Streptosporangium sp. NBC_01756]|uniref:tetratricopeptide repeat protein n=1 Tax=Streptosporangium sp. NBC_01756 TaxID=2975950 RepID=UPI002DDB1F69|nr:tetratricopeptide repeat protein [Streptosporangium sp. NBC_01756]WSC87980.1 hypothetical protein OIE48_07145 [Streptosporangium sp. NBC_01756]